jgi:autotransporter-associated beta strand protein
MIKTVTPTLIALIAGLAAAQAADVYMKASDASGTSSLSSAGQWTDGLAPSAANNYYSSNFFLRTPPSGNVTFAGNSLTLQPPSGQAAPMRSMLFKGVGGSTTIINNLTNAGGIINAASGNVLGIFTGNAMYVISNSTIQADQGPFLIGYPLYGSSDVTMTNTSGQSRTITYTNDLSGFKGRFLVDVNVNLALNHPNALGNPTALMADQIVLNTGATLTANTNITMANANGGIYLAGNANISYGSTGLTLIVSQPISGTGVLTKRGGGILTLAGDNSNLSGGVTMLTFTAGSQLNINSATALGSGPFTLGAGAVAPALLDNTSGSAKTLITGNAQTWSSSFTFLGSSSLNMGVGGVTMTANTTATVSNNNLTVGSVSGAFALTKQGAGTLTIDGGAFYTGNTTVNQGTLALITSGTLSSPTVTVATNATLDVSATGLTMAFGQTLAGNGTIAGAVNDGGGSTVINPGVGGAGTLTFAGNLSLTGGSTINFDLTPTPTTGSGVNDLIVVGGQLNISGATTFNLVGSTGSGVTYTLIQYNSFSGDLANVTIPAGFVLTNNTANKTIQLIASHVPANLTWRGDGAGNAWDIGVTANWIQSGTNQFFYNSDTVTFDNSGSNNVPVTLAADVSPAAVIVNASQNYTFSGGGIAAGSLTKSGSGTLILDNTNTYSGATVVNGGTLQLGDSSGAGGGTSFGQAGSIGSGPVTNNGALVFHRANDMTIAANINGSGSISNLGAGGTVTLGGTVSGSTVTMSGFGALRLNGSNDYTGLTLVTSGTLFAGNSNALGTTTAGTVVENSTLYVDLNQPLSIADETLTLNSGTLRRGGAQALTWGTSITLAGAGTLSVDGGSTLSITNAAGVSGTDVGLTLTGGGGGNGIIAGPITLGNGSVTVSGGNWNVAANNFYTGKTFLNGGQLTIPGLGALGPNPGSATPDFVYFGGGILVLTNDQTFTGGNRGLTVGSAGTLYLNATNTVSVVNDLNGGGNFTKWGIGTLILGGNNPFAGNVYFDGTSASANDGVTRIVSPTALANVPVTPGVATLFQGNNNSGWSTVQLDGTAGAITLAQDWSMNCRNNDNPNILNLVGNNTLSGTIHLNVGGSRAIFQSDAGLLTLSGTLQYDGALTGGRTWTFTGAGNTLVSGQIVNSVNGAPIGLTKNGTGKLTLSAANSYGNTTTVNGGVLELTGSITSTNGVVANGGALAGNGVINDNVVVSNSIASGTIDALTVNGNFTIAGNLAVDVNRAGLVSDHPIVSGTVSAVAGSVTVNKLGAALQVGDTFTLFSVPVTGGGALTISGGGVTWNNNLAVNGTISVASIIPTTPTSITAVPSGNALAVSWPGSHLGWVLQTQTNALTVGISTNWVDVPGTGLVTSTNIPVNAASPTVFFRLRSP